MDRGDWWATVHEVTESYTTDYLSINKHAERREENGKKMLNETLSFLTTHINETIDGASEREQWKKTRNRVDPNMRC